jgi:putative redox protein
MSAALSVRHLGGDQFAIDIRGHTVLVDQPVTDGGTDEAPTPTELFVAGLASCVAFYARRYLLRHNLPDDGLAVDVDWEMGVRPARVSDLAIRIRPPAALPTDRRDAFLAVASHCTVHNSLTQPPAMQISLSD